MQRRDFIFRSFALAGAGMLGTRELEAQQATQGDSTGGAQGTSNLFDMNQGAARTVTRPPKRGARPSMNADERDALEHQIRCQCGCTLDVYTCRTTDFSCEVSPAMHRDVMALVEGGYSAQEILDSFVGTYGERALMAPKKEGFNWAGYLVPFGALAAGAAAVAVVLRGMQRGGAPAEVPVDGVVVPPLGTADELSKLDAAIRHDD
ncbi:MAG: cytochrome c-type biogenesis protein CcmH [Gemmatimonadaceae bacterium]